MCHASALFDRITYVPFIHPAVCRKLQLTPSIEKKRKKPVEKKTQKEARRLNLALPSAPEKHANPTDAPLPESGALERAQKKGQRNLTNSS